MITFDQAYGYLHFCPLQQADIEIFPENEAAKVIRGHLHKHVLDVFTKEDTDLLREVTKKVDAVRIKRGVNAKAIAKRLHLALINFSIWRLKHRESEIILKDFSGEKENMCIEIDIARLKNNNEQIQLIWFRYDALMPNLSDFAKLIEKAQWNARGYELVAGNRPIQLTYFFPLLGIDYSVLYNTEGKYEVIAKLIKDKVFYIKPSEACDTCDQCPMSWAGYKGKLK